MQGNNIVEDEGLCPQERHRLIVDSLGCCEKVGRKAILPLWHLTKGDLGPPASDVTMRNRPTITSEIDVGADVDGDALVCVRVCSNIDAVRVDEGFLVDFQTKLSRQVPAQDLVEIGLWAMPCCEADLEVDFEGDGGPRGRVLRRRAQGGLT